MFNDVVTVFNYHSDKKNMSAKWYPTVIKGVELQITKGINVSKSGNDNANAATLHIPIDDAIAKKYKKPLEYKVLDGKQGYFTLKENDFFINGEYSADIIDEAEYPAGFFEYMKSTCDDVFNITTVDVYKVIPHFEVGGK